MFMRTVYNAVEQRSSNDIVDFDFRDPSYIDERIIQFASNTCNTMLDLIKQAYVKHGVVDSTNIISRSPGKHKFAITSALVVDYIRVVNQHGLNFNVEDIAVDFLLR